LPTKGLGTDAHGLPDGKKLLATLAKSIDPNHIGNLVMEDVTVSILEDKRLTRYPETPAESGLIHLANQGARYLAP
jgi:hypothetical protein